MAGRGRRWKVLVLGNVRPEGLDLLRHVAELTVLPEPVGTSDIAACIEDMDAVLHKTGRIDAGVMARQARLRIIARHGVGLDELDLDSIRAAGVPVSTTPGANSNAVAEATVGLALSVLRHLPRGEAMIKRDRTWKRESLMGRELGRSVVGIVGFGQIGQLAARYFAAFGARVIITDIDRGVLVDSPYPAVGLEELLRKSDVISLHCPLTAETRCLIDRKRLRLVKPDAIVVNTARGALVDENALVDSVTAGRLAGAALDVYDREPPDFASPLFACDYIFTTPHVAAMTIQAQTAMAVQAASEIRRVLVDGLPPVGNVLDRRPSGSPFATENR